MAAFLGLERGRLSRDLALAGASFAGGLVLLSLGPYRQLNPDAGVPEVPPALLVLTLMVISVAVALRRIATRTSLAIGTVAFVADLIYGHSLAILLIYTQVLYDACVYGPPRLWRWLLRITLALTAVAAVVGVVFLRPWSWQGVALAVPVMLIGVLPVLTGISVRQYRDQAAAELARAEQTARLAELDRRRAVAAERSRMARELHDVIANHLSAVAIHATAALSVSGLDRAQVDQALRVIRENSVQGLAEMRQMIGLLREPPGPDGSGPDGSGPDRSGPDRSGPDRPVGGPGHAPAGAGGEGPSVNGDARAAGEVGPGNPATRVRLAEVDRLLKQARDAGLSVRFATTGRARPLPVSVDLAAYRIVQESLTNALKHGPGQAEVTVGYQPDQVSLTIENPLVGSARGRTAVRTTPDAVPAAQVHRGADARPAGSTPAGADAGPPGSEPGADAGLVGAGAGLIGMRERAALLRGRFDAGPSGTRWRVHAELPLTQFAP